MNEHGRGWTRMTGRGVGRTASLLLLALIAWWVIAANLGCGRTPLPSIELDPVEVRITEPGQTGTVFATLERGGQPFEAEVWSTGTLPWFLSRTSLQPPYQSSYTSFDWAATNDVQRLKNEFGGTDFLPNRDLKHYLPFRAAYRLEGDPAEGDDRSTERFLTFTFSAPRIHSTVHNVGILLRTGFHRHHIEGCELQFKIENPWEDAFYRYRISSHAYSAQGERLVYKKWASADWTEYYSRHDFESPNRPHTFETKDHFPFEDQIGYMSLFIEWQATWRGNVISEGGVRVDVNPFGLNVSAREASG